MPDATFARPDLTTFTGLDRLGLEVTGQRLEPGRAVLACRVLAPDFWCRECGCEGRPRDSVVRRLAHEPFGWRPTVLHVVVQRYQCTGCSRIWRQDTTPAAQPRAKLSRAAVTWALAGLVTQHLSVARLAECLDVAWHTANSAVLAEGARVLIADPARFDAVAVIGVDEHVWRHTRHGEKYVTVVIDLTPIRDGTGPARLLDMVPGRSKQAFTTWLQARPQAFRAGVEVVAMVPRKREVPPGFTGFKTATTEQLPDAVAVMDWGHLPLAGDFHVVRLAGDAMDQCRRRVQQQLHGHRGRTGDPLYRGRRTLHTGEELLTDRQRDRLRALGAPPTAKRWGSRGRRARRGRGELGQLPADGRGLPRARPRQGPDAAAGRDRLLDHRRAGRRRRAQNPGPDPLLETGGFRPQLHPRLR